MKLENFLSCSSVQTLQQLAKTPLDLTAPGIFSEERINQFVSLCPYFTLSYATERVTDEVLSALHDLAQERSLVKQMEEMQQGAVVNKIHGYSSESRPALHTATRSWGPYPRGSIAQEDILNFIDQRTKNNEAETTLARRLISLKIFFKFLQENNLLSRDLFINHPKIWKRLPSILTEEEVSKLLALPLKSPTIQPYIAYRDTAILYTLYSTGIRVSELCGLHIYDINDDFIRVTGKGSKTRLVPLGKQAQTAIDQYLCSYRDSFQNKNPEENHLFLSVKGKKLERSCVWRRVQHYAKQISHKQVSPHSLRHAFATHLLNNQADLRIIQEMLGHARISSTEIYTHVAFDSVIEKFLNYHPRNL